MSKKQAAPAAATAEAGEAEAPATVEVRALVDCQTYNMKSGELAVIPSHALKALKDSGRVDDNPEAVAYAKTLTA